MCRIKWMLSLRLSVTAMFILLPAIFLEATVAPVQAQEGPVSYGGIEFPLGNKSFADKVVDFNPGSGTGESDGSAVIGPPDGGKDTGPSVIGAKGDVTLGKGGSITLKFTDNYLIDVEGLDLYVFEYGQDVEPFTVEISKDGSNWVDLGTVRGQPTGLDIHGKVASGDRFSYVRITDANPYEPRDPKTIGQSIYAGADIDAVGAIGAEEKPASDGDGAPGVTDPPPPTPGACDWSGTWNTSRGKMELVQTGNAQAGADVSGTASLMAATAQNQTGTIAFQDVSIVAVVLGDKLSGTWSQPPSYGPPKDAGDIEFTISPDCRSFAGNWRYGYGSGAKVAWDGPWTGTRSAAATPPATPPTTPATKQTVCASAKPSITEGGVFTHATFTIGGTQPQTIRITKSAENFSIKEEYGKVVFQVIKGKSWGSLTLEPGNYILSCNGGGAMGLMSASACVEYPVVGGTVPPGTPPVSPPSGPNDPNKPGQKDAPPPEMIKPTLPIGPIVKIIVRPMGKLEVGILKMEAEEVQRFIAWGVDADQPPHNEISVTVDEWKVVGDKNIGSINKDGVFKAGPKDGEVKILATVKNQEGNDITGAFPVTVSALPPITFEGGLVFEDENGKRINWPGSGYKIRCTYGEPPDDVELITPTDSKGDFKFEVPFKSERTGADFHLEGTIPAPAGYVWQAESVSVNRPYGTMYTNTGARLKPGFYIGFTMMVRLKKQLMYIKGHLTHDGKPVRFATVRLLDHNGVDVLVDPLDPLDPPIKSTNTGDYHAPLPDLSGGRYRLTAKLQGGTTTLHNWLINKQDIWVNLPITAPKTIDIEMISWADKIGYTGP